MEQLYVFLLILLSFLTCNSILAMSNECSAPHCFYFKQSDKHREVQVKDTTWTIFCYEGRHQDILLLWANPVLKLATKNGTAESFKFIYGESPNVVMEKKESALQLPQVLQNLKFMFNVDVKDMSFSLFNQSCIGIHSNQQYQATFKYKSRFMGIPLGYIFTICSIVDFSEMQFKPYQISCVGVHSNQQYNATFVYKNVELWYVAYLCIGMLIFLYAKPLSQNANLQYGSGVSLGIGASLLILMIILHRFIPQSLKKLGYMMVISSCCASLYFWQLFITSFSSSVASYWKWILGYLALTGFFSFGVCYKYGPITDQKSLNILQWVIQGLGLLLIYQGTQIPQLSLAFVIIILTLHNLPSGLYSNRLTRFLRYRLFKPKIKLLTEEEYQTQGMVETKKALDALRDYCQSPECKPWKFISRLKSPDRFASFVEGDSWHVKDQELLEYDSIQAEVENTEDSEQEGMIEEEELISDIDELN